MVTQRSERKKRNEPQNDRVINKVLGKLKESLGYFFD